MTGDVQAPRPRPEPSQRDVAAPPATTAVDDLQQNYLTAFLGYLPRHDEAALHRAYALGRTAVTAGVSLLQLARIHHEVFLRVLPDTPAEELPDVVAAASQFLLEVLAPHDMAQRVFLDRQTPPPS